MMRARAFIRKRKESLAMASKPGYVMIGTLYYYYYYYYYVVYFEGLARHNWL